MYKIFVVEDDSTIAQEMSKYLNRWGYDAFCVNDFNKVLEEFTQYEPQLVLMDISLP